MKQTKRYRKLYFAWYNLRRRCNNPKHKAYKHYGKRGIKVCKRWARFENFMKDMGEPASCKLQIERIDNNKHYSPSNCRWATCKEQHQNRRGLNKITYKGQTKTLSVWAQELGISRNSIYERLKAGHSISKIFKAKFNVRMTRTHEVFITYKGKTKYLKQWAKYLKMDYELLNSRSRKGWPAKKIFARTDLRCKQDK